MGLPLSDTSGLTMRERNRIDVNYTMPEIAISPYIAPEKLAAASTPIDHYAPAAMLDSVPVKVSSENISSDEVQNDLNSATTSEGSSTIGEEQPLTRDIYDFTAADPVDEEKKEEEPLTRDIYDFTAPYPVDEAKKEEEQPLTRDIYDFTTPDPVDEEKTQQQNIPSPAPVAITEQTETPKRISVTRRLVTSSLALGLYGGGLAGATLHATGAIATTKLGILHFLMTGAQMTAAKGVVAAKVMTAMKFAGTSAYAATATGALTGIGAVAGVLGIVGASYVGYKLSRKFPKTSAFAAIGGLGATAAVMGLATAKLSLLKFIVTSSSLTAGKGVLATKAISTASFLAPKAVVALSALASLHPIALATIGATTALTLAGAAYGSYRLVKHIKEKRADKRAQREAAGEVAKPAYSFMKKLCATTALTAVATCAVISGTVAYKMKGDIAQTIRTQIQNEWNVAKETVVTPAMKTMMSAYNKSSTAIIDTARQAKASIMAIEAPQQILADAGILHSQKAKEKKPETKTPSAKTEQAAYASAPKYLAMPSGLIADVVMNHIYATTSQTPMNLVGPAATEWHEKTVILDTTSKRAPAKAQLKIAPETTHAISVKKSSQPKPKGIKAPSELARLLPPDVFALLSADTRKLCAEISPTLPVIHEANKKLMTDTTRDLSTKALSFFVKAIDELETKKGKRPDIARQLLIDNGWNLFIAAGLFPTPDGLKLNDHKAKLEYKRCATRYNPTSHARAAYLGLATDHQVEQTGGTPARAITSRLSSTDPMLAKAKEDVPGIVKHVFNDRSAIWVPVKVEQMLEEEAQKEKSMKRQQARAATQNPLALN